MIEVSIYSPTYRIKVDKNGNQLEPNNDKVKIEFIIPKRPFLFWANYRQCERIQLPRGYGVAWKEWEKARLLFAPIPFNILVGLIIWTYHWVRIGVAIWFFRHKPKGNYL